MTGNFIALLAVCAFYAYCVGLAIAWLYRKNKREGGLVRALVWGGVVGFLLATGVYFADRSEPFCAQLLAAGAAFGFLGGATLKKLSTPRRQTATPQTEK